MRSLCSLALGLLLLGAFAIAQQQAAEGPLTAPAPTSMAPVTPANTTEVPSAEHALSTAAPVNASPAVNELKPVLETTGPASVPAEPVVAVKLAEPNKVLLEFVKSNRKWQLGFRHEPYNKISTFTVEHLTKALENKQLKSATELNDGCCKVTVELLQVSTRQALIKDPGIDVAANITVADAKGKLIFSKGYQGRSGTYFMNTWGHLINNACENMVENMAKDDVLVKVLQAGRLPD